MSIQETLESKFDPTDVDKAMQIAYLALRLMKYSAMAVQSDNQRSLLGRDLNIRLGSAITEMCQILGLVDRWASAREVEECVAELLGRTTTKEAIDE